MRITLTYQYFVEREPALKRLEDRAKHLSKLLESNGRNFAEYWDARRSFRAELFTTIGWGRAGNPKDILSTEEAWMVCCDHLYGILDGLEDEDFPI